MDGRIAELLPELRREGGGLMTEYIVEFGEHPSIEDKGALREKIVRCRDCKHCFETWSGYECERFSGEYHRAEPDGFCSWAERRAD